MGNSVQAYKLHTVMEKGRREDKAYPTPKDYNNYENLLDFTQPGFIERVYVIRKGILLG